MKKFQKAMAMLLSAAMVTGMAACSGSGSSDGGANSGSVGSGSGPDLSEHVVLTMYCIGDEGGIHAQEHLDKINEMLTEKLNCELKPVMVSWGDYRKKLPMVWASGEAYDLTFAANWSGYYTEGAKGAFMDITDLLPEYAPTIYASMEESGVIDTLKIDDKLYMVPTNLPDYTTFIYNYREDLRKKYNCPEIVDDETLEIYLQAIKDNEPGMQPFGANGTDAMAFQTFLNEQDWSRPLDNSVGFFVYDLKDPTKVFNVVDTPEYEEFVKKMRSYYEKGYVSQSIMANTDQPKDMFTAGKAGTYLSNFSNSNAVYLDAKNNHPDWEIGYYSSDLASGNVESTAPANNGMAIGAYSKNPERALMFLELMYTDRELYNLMMYGIEGVTYEWDEATGTKWAPEGVDPAELALKNMGMGLTNVEFELTSKDDSPVLTEMKNNEYAACALVPELSGFNMNQDPIAAELAALKAVQDEYKIVLDKGAVDAEEGLATLREKMKEAGADKVMEEINAQIAEYLAQ